MNYNNNYNYIARRFCIYCLGLFENYTYREHSKRGMNRDKIILTKITNCIAPASLLFELTFRLDHYLH
jgi:hypothetical protein